MILSIWIFLLPLAVKSCNIYNDYCDNMEWEDDILSRFSRYKRRGQEQMNLSRQELGRRVSQTLDNLFGHGYNQQLRPGTGNEPTQVEVNIAVR